MSIDISSQRVVVIGAGQAGYQLCAALRELSMACSITLIGDEPHNPYERPPLSKGYLLGEVDVVGVSIQDDNFYKSNNINLLLAVKCVAIDRVAKKVHLSNGNDVPYDKLVLATGSSTIMLPEKHGGALAGVYYLRNLADADRLIDQLKAGRKMLIVGGGYIGLEMASVATRLKLKVTVVEASERILSRVASPQTSDYFRQLHTEQGVVIREGQMLDCLLGVDGQLIGGRLSDGTDIQADIAVVGIGVRPCTEIAEAAGLVLDNGILVNAQCQTSDLAIFAIGDCASFPLGEGYARLESVGNAIDMAMVAASVIAGNNEHYEAKPRFWSDQYDASLQIVGLANGYDDVVTREVNSHCVSFWYYAGERLLAVDVINDSRTFLVAKRLVGQKVSPSKEEIKDSGTNLKALLKNTKRLELSK